MPEISQFTVPVTQNGQTTNVTYNFKDSAARSSSGAGKVSTTSDGVVSQLPGTTGGFLKNDGTSGGTWTSISIADLPGSSSKESIGVVRTSGELFMNGVYEPSVDGDGTEIDINDTTSGKAQLGRSNYRWSRIYGVTIEAANINVTNINGDELGSAAYADTENFLNSTNVDSSGSSGTSGWYNCRLYNGKIQYYNTNTTYSTTSSVTSGSSALVTSGGVYSALSSKLESTDFTREQFEITMNNSSAVVTQELYYMPIAKMVVGAMVYTLPSAVSANSSHTIGSVPNNNKYKSIQIIPIPAAYFEDSNKGVPIYVELNAGTLRIKPHVALTAGKNVRISFCYGTKA